MDKYCRAARDVIDLFKKYLVKRGYDIDIEIEKDKDTSRPFNYSFLEFKLIDYFRDYTLKDSTKWRVTYKLVDDEYPTDPYDVTLYCTSCNNESPIGSPYCPYCGKRVMSYLPDDSLPDFIIKHYNGVYPVDKSESATY